MTKESVIAKKLETDRVALEIIRAQTAAREAKTARLREARLARERAESAN